MNYEKQILKEFFRQFDTPKLYSILRSILQEGGFKLKNREDCETLLLNLSYKQILECKIIRRADIMRFLMTSGFTMQPNLSRNEFCLMFQSLVENQSNVQQVSITTFQNSNEYQLLEEFIKMFAIHYYDLLNNLGIQGINQLGTSHFYDDCTMVVIVLSGTDKLEDNCAGSSTTLQCLLNIKREYGLLFSLDIDRVKWEKDSLHDIIQVHVGGTLQLGIGQMSGLFEQQFLLLKDRQAGSVWKIFKTNFLLRINSTHQTCIQFQNYNQYNFYKINNIQ